MCEGEDWTALNRDIGALDVTTVHVYDRQVRCCIEISVCVVWDRH